MEARSIEAIVETMWSMPGQDVYAILDSARDPLVYSKLVASDARVACLYEGQIPREIAAVAPYLVKLRRDRFTEQLLESAWGRSWGIFATGPADFEIMRRHFRRFLRVQDEAGKTLLFRWYDPRVLRLFVPTCTEREFEALFGPIAAYYAESEDASRLNVYSRSYGIYSASQILLA